MALIEYLDKAGLGQVLEAVGSKLEYNGTLPPITFRRCKGRVIGSTIVVPAEVIWDGKQRMMLGLVKVEFDGNVSSSYYSRWPGCERWIDPETGKPWPYRLYHAKHYRGKECLAMWREGDEKPRLIQAGKRKTQPDAQLPLVSGVKRKYIPLHAQPGIVYRNRGGLINLRLGQDPTEIDIRGLYVKFGRDTPIPLSQCHLKLLYGMGGFLEHKLVEIGDMSGLEVMSLDGITDMLGDIDNHQFYLQVEELHPKQREDDGYGIRNLIALRRDGSGRMVFHAFSGVETPETVAPPLLQDISTNGNCIVGAHQVQTWMRGGKNNKNYAWRKCHTRFPDFGNRPTRHTDFKASRKQRTVFVRVRNVRGRTASEWLYLRLYRMDDPANNSWRWDVTAARHKK